MRRRVHQVLFVLLTMRLLLPPGICVCQWHSPAARFIVSLFNTGKEVPPSPPVETEDDHEPGCPASKLAAGMGLRPVVPPILPPGATFAVASAPETIAPTVAVFGEVEFSTYRPPDSRLYLMVCALLI
jgi:hypothetical protein